MNRRQFTQAFAAAAVAAAVPTSPISAETRKQAAAVSTPFPLSVMLWTVFNDLPFEERLAKVAEAGYSNVELVGEYAKWTAADFDKANAARKRLGIRFDATAGLKHGVGDPASRDALLAELKEALTPMETLACPAMILLSGNVLPGQSRDMQHQSCIESLKRVAALVEGRQIDGQPVRLLLECIDPEENPHYYLQSAAEAIEIVRAVNHPQVQFLYDLFHEQIAEGNLLEKLDKHIANVYRKLARLKYQHVVAMEFKPVGDAVAALRAAKTMVANTAVA
jgi:hydroxypyruvate isomerase